MSAVSDGKIKDLGFGWNSETRTNPAIHPKTFKMNKDSPIGCMFQEQCDSPVRFLSSINQDNEKNRAWLIGKITEGSTEGNRCKIITK